MTIQDRPVGVFDSGVGGISVLGQLVHQLPRERFIYYGDSANAPYGTKPTEQVLACVERVVSQLLTLDCKAIVIACNTATAVAAASLRARNTLPIIGMEPALKPAAQVRKNGSVLVLATPVTLELPKFKALYQHYGTGAIPLPCPGLMECVEAQDDRKAESYLRELLSGYDLAEVDSIVLGCTHYVFLRPLLERMLPQHIRLFDGNRGTAAQLERILIGHGLLSENGEGSVTLMTSGDPSEQIPAMQALLKRAENIANG